MKTTHELYEAVMLLIGSVKPRFGKAGDDYWFFLDSGSREGEGIAGFGKTGWDAALDFYHHFMNEGV